MQYSIIVVAEFLLGLCVITLLKKFSLRYNLLTAKGIPLIGGIGISLTFIPAALLSFLSCGPLSKEIIGLVLSSSMMLVFGIIDDWHELSIWTKFLVQIIATGLLVFFGIRTHIVYIGNLFNIIITFIWILGISNAFNHLDVIDGVASGVAIIVCLTFLIISFLNKDISAAILSLTLAVAVCSFFLQNLPPAKIYLGNAGSHFLGFVLAAIAIIISYASLERKIALVTPLLILGFPIIDTTFLVLMRIMKKNLPFKKTNDHLALRYLVLSHSKKKTLFAMLSLCLFYCLCAIAVSQVSNIWDMVIIAAAFFVSLIITVKMGKVTVND
jgi:UDP-GlcNAc:undecaprenyl-phosphate GlcNAc-1-phosphate transferase